MATPNKRGQRYASTAHKQMTGAAVAALKILTDIGVPEPEAALELARVLNGLGIKKLAGIGVSIAPETVIEWKSKIAEGPKDGAAAITLRAILREIKPPVDMHKTDKKTYILNGLKRVILGFRVFDHSAKRLGKDSTLMPNKVPADGSKMAAQPRSSQNDSAKIPTVSGATRPQNRISAD